MDGTAAPQHCCREWSPAAVYYKWPWHIGMGHPLDTHTVTVYNHNP